MSDRLAVEIDLVQYERQGPCLAAIDGGNRIRVDILERDRRFSRFAPGALAMDINRVLSLPLPSGDGVVGALNLYSRLPNAFDTPAEQAAQPLVGYAAEAIATSALYAYALDMVEGLLESLENQAIIARAVGLVSVTEKRTSGEALERLRALALASGHSMRTMAGWAIEERPKEIAPLLGDELPDP